MIDRKDILIQLKQQEKLLLEQLEKIREKIGAFGGQDTINSYSDVSTFSEFGDIENVDLFNLYATYDEKIIWTLRQLKRPLYVKEIVAHLKSSGETADLTALTKRITYNASKLYRDGVLAADKRQKQYKYSIKKSDFSFIVETNKA